MTQLFGGLNIWDRVPEFESLAGKDTVMAEALLKLMDMSMDQPTRRAAESRAKWLWDEDARMRQSRREGEAIGRIEIARRMLQSLLLNSIRVAFPPVLRCASPAFLDNADTLPSKIGLARHKTGEKSTQSEFSNRLLFRQREFRQEGRVLQRFEVFPDQLHFFLCRQEMIPRVLEHRGGHAY